MQNFSQGCLSLASRRRFKVCALGVLIVASLTGCGTQAGGQDQAAPSQGESESAEQSSPAQSSNSHLPAVPGYAVGEIPPVPLFRIPNISVLSQPGSHFKLDLYQPLTSVSGIIVEPAVCDGSGVVSSDGTTIFNGSGGFTHTSSEGDKGIVVGGDGTGSYINEADGISIIVGGDGTGSYINEPEGISITNGGDGSGSYINKTTGVSITVDSDGSGSYINEKTGVSTLVGADGSGSHIDESSGFSIANGGDGKGSYVNERLSLNIVNYGDGTGVINGVQTQMEPLAKVGALGTFPPVDSIPAVEFCGTRITLEDSVLFDFGLSQIRSDAKQTLSQLSQVLKESGAPTIEVNGHTDSISDEAFNQKLSEDRAVAVADFLREDGVGANLTAKGFGESQPVAANENPDGSDNPAGRQANRRVEIFIPSF